MMAASLVFAERVRAEHRTPTKKLKASPVSHSMGMEAFEILHSPEKGGRREQKSK